MAEGRGPMGPLLVVKLVVFLIILGLAGWSLDKCIDGEQTHPHIRGNPSTNFMLLFALLSGVLGSVRCYLASPIFAHDGMRVWPMRLLWPSSHRRSQLSHSAACGCSLAIKELVVGGYRGKRLRTLEAFIVISMLNQVLYLGLLLARIFSCPYGSG